jgi:hypothetical protein
VDQVLNAMGAMLDPKGIGGICPGEERITNSPENI